MAETETLVLKISGPQKPLNSFLDDLEKRYPLHIRSEILPNDKDNGFHVFEKLAVLSSPSSQDERAENAAPTHTDEEALIHNE